MTIYAMSQINLTEIRVEDFWEMDETLSNVSIRQIEIPEWWKDRNRTVLLNMVLMEDGSLYVGERYGVIGVRDGKITYYPIDHNAALYGEKKN